MKLKYLLVLTIISFILILWVELGMIPLYFPDYFGNGRKINNLITNFSISYISAFFFYLVVVYAKERKDKANSNEFVLGKINAIINTAKYLIVKLEESKGSKFLKDFPDNEELVGVFARLKPDTIADDKRLYKFTWEDYTKEVVKGTEYSINRILALLQYVDSDLVRIVSRIQDCEFFYLMNNTVSPSFISQKITYIEINLSYYSKPVADYLKLIQELEDYYKSNLKTNKK